MPDSPSSWLRSLAAEATPTLKWPVGTPAAQIMERRKVESRSGRLLKSMAPDLAVLCADAIDALRYARDAIASPDIIAYAPGKDIYDTHMMMGAMRRADDALARFAALQPDNTEEGT